MTSPFQLAVCAEMLWPQKPLEWRVARLTEQGFGIGLWNCRDHDIDKLESLKNTRGANYTIMNGTVEGRLADDEGADSLLRSARETISAGNRLGVNHLNLQGTAIGDNGIPKQQIQQISGAMWLKAQDTLNRICDLAEEQEVFFSLENLNPLDHPGCPFGRTADVLSLVSSVDRPQLRINLDLYHTQLGEGDLVRWCEKCLPWIGEVQIADNPGRFEPGTGEINYPHIARALSQMGYGGTVLLEAYASGDTDAALTAFQHAFTLN